MSSTTKSRRALAVIGSYAVCAVLAAALSNAAASSGANENIPQLGSANFGWETDVGDWQDPPEEMGHGPMHADPVHPYISNAEGARFRAQPTFRIGDAKDSVLKPWAAKVIADSNEQVLTGKLDVPFTATARCYPGGVPGQLLFVFEPIYFVQTTTEVWMFWQRDQWVRRIFLNRDHSKNLKPSWFGESVGHYEDGALVVDTLGLSAHMSFIDNYRTPHSEKLHVVERYAVEPGDKFLKAEVTVDDPDTFNAPLHMTMRWFKVNAPMGESVCAENNNDNNYFGQKLVPIPQENKHVF